ncbi:hypothetical protein MPTK1_7g02180 [Marchantia polymorpha subsp. ruderalis]|uniref:GDSL esterase/lipase n=2 Tax=Marchantia polymorpha TaxID=3197 RepID=A0AAF6BVB1_MARPO|nr:hypothetical protein MARPO_0088s0069 [Marchantia polymorpha]BBN15945.1 hypothetical protein Mp_7g02180 [Marchantia polymorpha subsp. ruderalis]|eukprot:PTQ33527.1 hypothetical protein MARPO_0088s0069 [Marchantia polymorpha]
MTRLRRSALLSLVLLGLVAERLVEVEATGCFPAIFSFGDGQFDTGGLSATFPTILHYDHPPYGQTYFQKPTGRHSDGRLMIDFLAEALGLDYTPAALQTVLSDYTSGGTWASSYSTIASVSSGNTAGPGLFLSPFGLNVQLMQFNEYQQTVNSVVATQARLKAKAAAGFTDDSPSENKKKQTKSKKTRHILQELDAEADMESQTMHPTAVNATLLELEAPTMRLPRSGSWGKALYLIATGGHDITNQYNNGKNIDTVVAGFPRLIGLIADAVRQIYRAGGRNLIVFDIEPQGCQPWLLTRIPHTADDLDWKGCLIQYNAVVQNFNKMLKSEVAVWREGYTDLNVFYFSQYDVKIGLLTNDTAGFNSTNTACCGVAGSTYNVNLMVPCGPPVMDPVTNITTVATVCNNPDEYLYWDGMYTTEAGNRYVMQQMLTGNFFDVPFPELTENCQLNPLT